MKRNYLPHSDIGDSVVVDSSVKLFLNVFANCLIMSSRGSDKHVCMITNRNNNENRPLVKRIMEWNERPSNSL